MIFAGLVGGKSEKNIDCALLHSNKTQVPKAPPQVEWWRVLDVTQSCCFRGNTEMPLNAMPMVAPFEETWMVMGANCPSMDRTRHYSGNTLLADANEV